MRRFGHLGTSLYHSFTVFLIIVFACFGVGAVTLEEVRDLKPDIAQLDYWPADGAVTTSNPPSFVWIPASDSVTYRLEYSQDPTFSPAYVTVIDGIDLSVYTPDHILDATAPWYWRVRPVNPQGVLGPPNRTRMFRIGREAVELPLPEPEELRSRIPTDHPRLFVTPETLGTFREKRRADMLFQAILWNHLQSEARGLLYTLLPDEPPHASPGGVWDVKLWEKYVIASQAADNMEKLAFGYMITGDTEFGEAARRWMLHLASWDPYGATSAAVNDEASMPILLKMSRAYTWAYDALTPEDRKVIQHVIRVRANEAYMLLKNRPFESRPYGSHDARQLGFLIEPAIAFMGEIPEARDWFDYAVRVIFAVYPAWGGDAGGWSEGQAYWQSYVGFAIRFVDALREATGLDLFEKAFFKNTGYFKLYTHPPYATMGPFGDFANRKPSVADAGNMRQFAVRYNEPHFQWYAEQLGGGIETGVMGYIQAVLRPPFQLKGEPPLELPASRFFDDIGWVAMHRHLGDAANDIQFMFRSSPYGSWSHSMADQNTFTLEAYGEPLAISSGYRPWYGSVHHLGWTKTTQAHNGVLVNGRGQPVQSFSAKGEVLQLVHGKSFDYTVGDAQQAYPGLLERFHRHVVYVRPDVFVLFDDLDGVQASQYSWLLHTYHQMDVDAATGSIVVKGSKAVLQGQLWSASPLTLHQTNQFAIPLDEPMDVAEQWHLTVTTRDSSETGHFLAVLRPTKENDVSRFEAEQITVASGQGVRVEVEGSVSEVLFRTEGGVIETEELRSDGRVAAWSRRRQTGNGDEESVGLLLADGTEWAVAVGLGVQAPVPISVELTLYMLDGRVTRAEGSFHLPDGIHDSWLEVLLHMPSTSEVGSVQADRAIEYCLAEGVVTLLLPPGLTQIVIE